MFEYKNKDGIIETFTLEALQTAAANQGLEFENYLQRMKKLGMTEVEQTFEPIQFQPTSNMVETPGISKGSVVFEERDAWDIIKSKAASFAKMPVNALDNFIKIYETGEYPVTYEDSFWGSITEVTGELVVEGPIEASLGYAAKYLRDKGYDIPDRVLAYDLTTPEERREKYENFLLDVRKDPEMTLEIAKRLDPTNRIKFEGAIEWLNKYTHVYRDENGNPLDYLDLYDQGEYAASLDAFTDDLSAGIPSLIISRAPYGIGAAFLGAGS